ncbi:MAG: hypothetical protein JNJ99_11205 [Crocinitomicaceae bacterium]|nr:hypothetical protein [Crocinitomicaceae bacterium]
MVFFSILGVFLTSCGGNAESTIQNNGDSISISAIDTSSVDAFIKTFTENRKSTHSSDFKITGNCILENGVFRIINFIETIGNYNYEYCIVMNPQLKVTLENPDKDSYIEVQQIITDNNFNMSLYQGNLAPIYYDLKGDGSDDYQLTLDESYNTDYHVTQTIVIYDGKNALDKTEITARSIYAVGATDDFSGSQESMEFKQKGKNLPQIILTHKEHDFKPDESYQTGIGNFEYTLTWQWSEKGAWGVPEWVTSFKANYKNCQTAVNEFSKPRFLLSDEYEGYAVVENCQNGGPEHFMLNPFSDDQGSDYCVIGDNFDDVGSSVLLYIFEQETQYTLLFGRYEKFEANIKGYRHIGFDTDLRFISKRGEGDTENHWGTLQGSNSLYTVDMNKYNYITCN